MKTCFKMQIVAILVLAQSNSLAQNSGKCVSKEFAGIEFKKNSTKLSAKAKKSLDSLSVLLKTHPDCQLTATTYFADLCDKCGEMSWDRAQNITSYLVKKGVPIDKILFTIVMDANSNIVDLAVTPYIKPEDAVPPPIIRHN